MSRSRRSGDESPVSLFSFQDIMTSVMGILILVTLILALQITRTAEAIAHPTPSAPQVTQSDVGRLRGQVNDLQKQLERRRAELHQVTELVNGGPEQAAKLQAEMERSTKQLQELKDRIRAAQDEVAQRGDTQAEEKQKRLDELIEQVIKTQTELEQKKRNPRMTYLIQEKIGKRPLLLQCDGNSIGIGVPDASDQALWIVNASENVRLRALGDFAKSRDRANEYFVILLKPSNFEGLDDLKKTLTGAGFNVGVEVIEEKTMVLPPP